MIYSSQILAQLLEKNCVSRNINKIVISPGSRNAPLIIEFTNKSFFEAYSIVDERCAAFFALGMAQQTQQPVVVFCTSGSALLNYYPAVAEAFYSNIPLIIVSADRPSNKIDIADGQTIRQKNVFANHSLYNANLLDAEDEFAYNVAEIEKAIAIAILKKGPVHINMPFEEPLYKTVTTSKIPDTFKFDKISDELKQPNTIDSNVLDSWNASDKKMILVGTHYPDKELNKLLSILSEDDSVIVLTETTSNLHHPNFINTIDNLIFSLSDDQLEFLKPDCLITLGGMVVSKRVKQFLRQFKPQHHWHVSEFTAPDTYFCLSGQVAMPSADFFTQLIENKSTVESHFKKDWLQRKMFVEQAHNTFMEKVPFSDLSVFNNINKALPKHIMLQLANSSVIRYAQLFHLDKTITVFCNRGTSGIDGSTSTAIGAALTTKQQTVFMTGDLSFFYDSNALWNNYMPANFRIILINNGGGGIFRILPGPQTTKALDYFEAPHNLTAEHLCKMYGFEYTQVGDDATLNTSLEHFFKESPQPKLLEVTTPRELNDKVLKDYFKTLN